MTRLVSLAMYDVGGAATAGLWETLRAQLTADGLADVPEDLTVPNDYEALWLAPDLLLAQTCGYPLRHALDDRVSYVGTPVYDVEGTDGPYYRSALVVRVDDEASELADLRCRRAAYNSRNSQSGYNGFREAVSRLARDGRFFSSVVATGSHAGSLEAVIAGKADIAAIDPVSLALTPSTIRNKIKTIGWTNPAPGLPLITAQSTSHDDVNILRRNIGYLFADTVPSPQRAYLNLTGFEILPTTAYDDIDAMENAAFERGYPVLA